MNEKQARKIDYILQYSLNTGKALISDHIINLEVPGPEFGDLAEMISKLEYKGEKVADLIYDASGSRRSVVGVQAVDVTPQFLMDGGCMKLRKEKIAEEQKEAELRALEEQKRESERITFSLSKKQLYWILIVVALSIVGFFIFS